MKITEFDPNLEDSKWSKMLRRIIKRIEKHKQYYLSGKKKSLAPKIPCLKEPSLSFSL